MGAQQYVAVKSNPLTVFRFTCSFSSTQYFSGAGFATISGLSASVATIQYREGGQQPSMRKFPGLAEFPVIRFGRGALAYNSDMYNWLSTVQAINPSSSIAPLPDTYDNTGFRQTIYIQGFDSDMSTVTRSWTLLSCWPKSVTMGDFDAQSSAVQIETMEIETEAIIPGSGPLGINA